eukprot:3365659-Amphidinium_carterae.1
MCIRDSYPSYIPMTEENSSQNALSTHVFPNSLHFTSNLQLGNLPGKVESRSNPLNLIFSFDVAVLFPLVVYMPSLHLHFALGSTISDWFLETNNAS